MGNRGRDSVSPRKNPYPSHSDSQLGGITKEQIFSLRDKGFELHTNPQVLHRKYEPSKDLALKINREYVQENYRASGNRKYTLKGLTHKFTVPENQCKNNRLESPWTISERDILINLEATAGEAGTSQDTSQGLSHWQEPFMRFQSTLLISALAGAILEFST